LVNDLLASPFDGAPFKNKKTENGHEKHAVLYQGIPIACWMLKDIFRLLHQDKTVLKHEYICEMVDWLETIKHIIVSPSSTSLIPRSNQQLIKVESPNEKTLLKPDLLILPEDASNFVFDTIKLQKYRELFNNILKLQKVREHKRQVRAQKRKIIKENDKLQLQLETSQEKIVQGLDSHEKDMEKRYAETQQIREQTDSIMKSNIEMMLKHMAEVDERNQKLKEENEKKRQETESYKEAAANLRV
jgi:hypothetical protein